MGSIRPLVALHQVALGMGVPVVRAAARGKVLGSRVMVFPRAFGSTLARRVMLRVAAPGMARPAIPLPATTWVAREAATRTWLVCGAMERASTTQLDTAVNEVFWVRVAAWQIHAVIGTRGIPLRCVYPITVPSLTTR